MVPATTKNQTLNRDQDMGIKNLFNRLKTTKEKEPDPISDLTLKKLKKGYLVDYDLKSWEVISANRYDWGEGDLTYEWQLTSHDDILFLERETDDEDYWCISRKISLTRLDGRIIQALKNGGDPSETMEFDGKTYYLDETGGAHFYKDDALEGKEVFKWDYIDDSGKNNLTIEQWGERDFEVSLGEKVHEYQFTNILPSV